MRSLVVITGASRGLGAALANHTAGPGVQQLLIARSNRGLEEVRAASEARGAEVRVVAADLADPGIEDQLANAIASLDWAGAERATLFNNASLILPIRRLERVRAAEADAVVRVNLTAAIWLSAQFLDLLSTHPDVQGEVINVSTGVSLRPLAGWSLYCCSKAGLNLLAASIVEETKGWSKPVRAASLNPGPLDTEMQRNIRENPYNFPDRARFLGLHEAGGLASADAGARRVLSVLDANPFPNGQFVDLKDR